ncbi:MAG: PHP domain-containing protein [Deltaproteobacteria bacterium]|nr:PHP domain-containing protein [Deltaproteobacteria bacterium]MBW2048194.1 PHP domain-containing protein [Deltaproteobacteria bacterium]MBW2110570.1 PHP domain-containing protein [Deltaproteobacteria bacterium]MBW2352137.1 PHP domain-containing protein [Deltaproteobacteria bacterium]HDZ90425.1 PHP domain-containing protein [Deltaproteobacteria bacterium]
MKIDLHIHSRDCSDGRLCLSEIFQEARSRGIGLISITDHDNVDCQEEAEALSCRYGIRYIAGVELNISFSHPRYRNGKPVSLDLLGYQYDIHDRALIRKIGDLKEHRRLRAQEILEKINRELRSKHQEPFTERDLEAIEKSVDGSFGRPHIANYMVKKGMVRNRQEAFDRYLVRCNVPKMPLSLEEASTLIHRAGGKLMLAHGNDPNGTSLVSLTPSLEEQCQIIRESMLPFLDGLECWHSRHSPDTVSAYLAFAEREGLMVTGGSDCHQDPVIMGTAKVPSYVAAQFNTGEGKSHP